VTDGDLDTFLGSGSAPRRRPWATLAVLAAVLVAAFLLLMRFFNGPDLPYYSAPVERADLTPVLAARGSVHGENEVILRAPMDGTIASLQGPAEGPVAAGQVLATLDSDALRSGLAAAQMRVAETTATLASAQAGAEEAGSRMERFDTVWRKSAGRVPSLGEMDHARADLQRAIAALVAARADLATARQEAANRQADLDAASLKAPFAGYLAARHVDQGQPVVAGAPVVTLLPDARRLEASVVLGTAEAMRLPAGAHARVLVAGTDKPVEATLLRLEAGRDDAHARALFRLSAPQPGLRVGTPAAAEIDLPLRRQVLVVPDAALGFAPLGAPANRGDAVYVLDDSGQTRRVQVIRANTDGQRSEVLSAALQPGMQVVTGWRHAPPAAAKAP